MDCGPVAITTGGSVVLTTATGWLTLPAEGGGSNDRFKAQLMRLFVATTGGTPGATFNLYLVLADQVKAYGATLVACTITSIRSGLDGVSGDNLCTVSINGREVADLLGMNNVPQVKDKRQWLVGCPDGLPAGVTAINVDGALTPVV